MSLEQLNKANARARQLENDSRRYAETAGRIEHRISLVMDGSMTLSVLLAELSDMASEAGRNGMRKNPVELECALATRTALRKYLPRIAKMIAIDIRAMSTKAAAECRRIDETIEASILIPDDLLPEQKHEHANT